MATDDQILGEKMDSMQASLDAMQERATTAIEAQRTALEFIRTQNAALTALVEELKANAPNLTDDIAKADAAINDANAFLAENPPVDETPVESGGE